MDTQTAVSVMQKMGTRLAIERDIRRVTDEDCNRILDERFSCRAGRNIYNHKAINLCQLIPEEKIFPSAERDARLEQFGFRFEAFFALISELGFLEASGLSADNLQPAHLLNILNGGARIDYEDLFPEAKPLIHLIKRHKAHKDPTDFDAGRSFLNTPDILLATCIERLTRGLPEASREEYFELTARVLDLDVPNAERLRYIGQLELIDQMIDNDPKLCTDERRRLQTLVRDANDELGTLEDWVWKKGHPVDGVIPLHGGDCSGAGYLARMVIAVHPQAFLIPVGGYSPHQIKTLGETGSLDPSESDEILAAAMVENFRHRYQFLGALDPGKWPALTMNDIIPLQDRVSIDTSSNAREAAPAIRALRNNVVHPSQPLSILLITSSMHAARARVEFDLELSKEFGPQLEIVVLEIPRLGAMEEVERARPVALGNLFSEYIKRLFKVSVR